MSTGRVAVPEGALEAPAGAALTLLLIPGLGNNERLWAAQVEYLGDTYRCNIADYRGSASIREMSDAVLSRAPQGPLLVVGFSLGSYIALDIVTRFPERVQKLALISASPYADDETTRAERRRVIDRAAHDYAGLLRDVASFVVAPDGPHAAYARRVLINMGEELGAEEFARQQLAAMERPDCRALLSDIRCPTRVLCGSEDPVTPPGGNQFLADRIPQARLEIIENAGHLLPLECPDAVNGFLARFAADG